MYCLICLCLLCDNHTGVLHINLKWNTLETTFNIYFVYLWSCVSACRWYSRVWFEEDFANTISFRRKTTDDRHVSGQCSVSKPAAPVWSDWVILSVWDFVFFTAWYKGNLTVYEYLLWRCLREKTREQQRFYNLGSGNWLAWASDTAIADN